MTTPTAQETDYSIALDRILNTMAHLRSSPPETATLIADQIGATNGAAVDEDTNIAIGLLVEALHRIRAAQAITASRLGAGNRIAEHEAEGDDRSLVFYSGASFALAHVGRALRGGSR